MNVPTVQISANDSGQDGSTTRRRIALAKPVSRPAKPANNSGTHRTTRKAVEGPVGPSKACEPVIVNGSTVTGFPAANAVQEMTQVVMPDLRPKQVLAATLLVQGRQGRDVAKALNVTPETISRWRHHPDFQALMHRLLQETVDATRLGIVSLCAEAIDHLRGLVRSFNDDTSLKAITLVLGKVGPVLGVIGAQLRQPPPDLGNPTQ